MRKLFRWIRNWWQRNTSIEEPTSPAPPAVGHNRPPSDAEEREAVDQWRREIRDDPVRSESMSHYYFDHLLRDLDHYFDSLRRMRRCDPDAYAFYRRVGAQVAPHRALCMQLFKLPPSWRDGSARPSEGMVHFAEDDDRDPHTVYIVFGSFKKVKQPADCEPCKDDIFECTCYYRHRKILHGKMLAATFYVGVDSDGNVRQLRQRMSRRVKVPRSKKCLRRHRNQSRALTKTEWTLPDWMTEARGEKGLPAPSLFCSIASGATHLGSDGFQVRVRKDDLVARFNISLLRTPYFFKNREKTVTESGQTKPIFHIVRAHRRVRADGSAGYVKTHFRGVRRFDWQGYRVVISMPGLHHIAFDDWTLPCEDMRDTQEPAINAGQVGVILDHILDGDTWEAGFRAAQVALENETPINKEAA